MVASPTTADEAIARYRAIEDPAGRDLQALAELAALVCDVPNSAINLITRDHQHQIAAAGIDPSVCSREDSMCAAVLGDTSIVVAPDASLDPRFASNPFVSGVIDTVRFYASAPLTTPEGTTIGRLCVFDTEPHELAAARAETLKVVAARVVDVLELRLRGRQLEQALAEVNRSNELLSVFAGQVSHDLRSPLTAVLANTEILATEPAVAQDPASAELVAATTAAGRRMAAMIDTILAYARVGAALRKRPVELDDLLDHVVSDLAALIGERGAVISRVPLPRVEVDPEQVYAVWLNLLSNAVKFTPAGRTPEIAVSVTGEGDAWWFTVSDNGNGIPADQRDSLFELHARGNRTVEGSGIGLATARRAVEAHGGAIGIEDSAAGGATFWFTLPR